MQIFVKTLVSTMVLDLDLGDFVDDVKREIQKLNEHCNPERQCLMVRKGNREEYLVMEDRRTLGDYNVQNRSTIYLFTSGFSSDYYREHCVRLCKDIDSSCK